MYQDTITLFNRKRGSSTTGDTWYPTVIRGVNLNIDRAAILEKYGAESKDNASLHIRYTRKNGEIRIVCDEETEKPWMSPKEWDKTIDSITFNPDGDFFWKGEWTEGIVSDKDYSPDGFYGFMNREHDYVFTISSVGGPYSIIPHFEIMGK